MSQQAYWPPSSAAQPHAADNQLDISNEDFCALFQTDLALETPFSMCFPNGVESDPDFADALPISAPL